MNMDMILFGSFSHVIIMTLKVDPHTGKFYQFYQSKRCISMLKKAQLIIANLTNALPKQLFHMLFVLTV
jgi:hypothetical protein